MPCPAPWPLPCHGVPRTQLSSPPHSPWAVSCPLSLSVGSFASCLAETRGCGPGALTSLFSFPPWSFPADSHPPSSRISAITPLRLVWIPLLETQDGGSAQSLPSRGLRPPCCCPRASFLPRTSVLRSFTRSARRPFPPRNLPEAEVLWVSQDPACFLPPQRTSTPNFLSMNDEMSGHMI